MQYLIDTHVALWAVLDDTKLGDEARVRLLDPGSRVFVSAASLWEIAIKHALRPKEMPLSADDAAEYFNQSGFEPLAVNWAHARRVAALPSFHRDPFDRILVAQALEEPLVLLTRDEIVASYSPTFVHI